MAPVIRPATLDDASRWAEIVAAASPYLVQDATSTAHEMRTEPSDAVRLVAEVEGVVVGIARLRAYEGEEHCSLLVMVDPLHRRRGVGRALLDAMAGHVTATGRTEVHSIVEDDEDSRIASVRWGFELTRTFRMAAVDPRIVPAPEPDCRVVRLSSREPEEVWRLHNRIVVDDPSGLSLETPWEEWLDDWDDPRNRPDLSHGVVVDGGLVAFSQLGSAGDRAWSNMTGTHPDHRGQGFALLSKQHTLAAAAAAGIATCFTGNDATNAPMVAVNTRLGYTPFAAPRLATRRVGANHPPSRRKPPAESAQTTRRVGAN